MFCGQCGNQIDDNANVCPYCGNVLRKNTIPNISNLSNIKSKKNFKIAVAIAVVVAIPVIVCSLPSVKIIRNILNEDYEEAIDIYDDSYDTGDGSFILNKGLLYVAEKCEEDLINGKIDTEDAFDIMTCLMSIGVDDINDQIEDIDNTVATLRQEKFYIEDGDELYEDGNYSAALSKYNMIDENSPLYASVSDKKQEIAEKIKAEVVNDLDEYIKNDNHYQLADYIINDVKSLNDDTVLTEAMNKYYTYLDTKIDKYLADNMYDDAVTLLEYANGYFYNDATIKEKTDNLEKNYVDSTLEKAEQEFSSGNYEVAASTVQVALQQVEDNAELMNKYEEYKAYIPSFINDLDYFTLSGDIFVNRDYGKLADNTGKAYGRLYSISVPWREDAGRVEYLINGKYTNFEGTCGVAYDERTNEDTQFFEVYGDGKLLYTSPTFTTGTMPSTFNIDIRNVKILKIVYPSSGNVKLATIFDGKVYNQDKMSEANNTEETTQAEETTVKADA